jgi:type 2 lantibiotic biosynthesis protein LanM
MEGLSVVKSEELWQRAEWYQALSLTERRAPDPPGASSFPRALERAQARPLGWKSEKSFQRGPLFEERLALDSLSEPDLLAILAEPAANLKARSQEVPEWLAALQDAFEHTECERELIALLEESGRDHALGGVLPALGPLFQRGLVSVQRRVEALQRHRPSLPFDTAMLPTVFVAALAPAVLFKISKPVILELNIARLEERLEGATGQDRFLDFVRRLTHDQGILPLLAKYPVLARQLVVDIDQWADYLSEFLTHLSTDWDAVCQTFTPDLGELVEVEAGKGDTHRRGRSVLLLRFSSGKKLLYKPKPLAVDVHFQELLGWLNERGAHPPLRPLKLLNRGTYGWSEFVRTSPCSSEEEVRRFYQRQGGYLAVLYALDATDLHNENLIAAGEHPMLVDLEALFHPYVQGKESIPYELAAAEGLDESVWQVGLLPRLVWSDGDSPGIDTSGLGGLPGQMNPHRLIGWDKPGTDEMRVIRRRTEMPDSENRPRLGDEDVDVLHYADAIVTGFTEMYQLLCEHKDALLAEQLSRFEDDEVRVLVRNTNVYALLLYEGFHPDLLRDALDRDRFLDRLWMEAAQHRYLPRVIGAERRDLLRGDIPVFTTTPGSRTIFTSEHEPLPGFLEASGLEGVRRRLRQLGDEDLCRQRWIIEASLATLQRTGENRIPRPTRPSDQSASVQPKHLLALATSIGRRLDELAFQSAESASWLALGPVQESTWGLFPAGPDLYAGNGGVVLFLAYLSAVTGDPSHGRLAERALMSVRRQVHAWLEDAEEAGSESPPPVGAFEGLGSIVYVLAHLGALWDDGDLLTEAEELVETLRPYVSRDKRLDVIYGSAGCILSLFALHEVRPSSRTLEVAIRCGERLLATARRMPHGIAWTTLDDQPPLGGFSHGTAGIAYSLLTLADRSGQDRFRSAALGALDYDRSLFIPALNNWADLRVFPDREPDPDQTGMHTEKSMVAWCHGAAGIGLGRLGALGQLDDARTREEIRRAVQATTGYGFSMNHSLCHGALGNLELLLTAARVLDRAEDHDVLDRATAVLVASIDATGPVTAVPLGVDTPGFMMGLAGIGYELLRLAEPEKVPSVLLLAPPRGHA